MIYGSPEVWGRRKSYAEILHFVQNRPSSPEQSEGRIVPNIVTSLVSLRDPAKHEMRMRETLDIFDVKGQLRAKLCPQKSLKIFR